MKHPDKTKKKKSWIFATSFAKVHAIANSCRCVTFIANFFLMC